MVNRVIYLGTLLTPEMWLMVFGCVIGLVIGMIFGIIIVSICTFKTKAEWEREQLDGQ